MPLFVHGWEKHTDGCVSVWSFKEDIEDKRCEGECITKKKVKRMKRVHQSFPMLADNVFCLYRLLKKQNRECI